VNVENSVYPNDVQIAAFAEPGPDGPIYMVNLLKFKDLAKYDDGRETTLSGREAYQIYANAVTGLLGEFGGALQFHSQVSHLTIGEVEDLWDDVAIAMYPNRAAMMAMGISDRMQEIGVHRAAGLKGQLNIETFQPPGAGPG
jgi:hypothetical protein